MPRAIMLYFRHISVVYSDHGHGPIQAANPGMTPIQSVNEICLPSRPRIWHGLVGIGKFMVHIRLVCIYDY